jgi:trigger factor
VKAVVEPLEGNKVKLSIEVDEAEFDKAIDNVFRQIAREVRIPGFRPGKAPRRLLEARVGTEHVREQALQDALPLYYSEAVREHEVDVIAPPEFNITAGETDGAVAFDAVVEVRPKVMVPGYGGLRVTLPRPEATDEEVDAQVNRLREQFGELETVGRPARDGDHVSINLNGSRLGEPVPGLNADDYLYEVGKSHIAPALDDQLRGAKVGDVLEFSAPVMGSTDETPVDFRVLVKEIKEKLLPEVDDEWANEVSEFDTVEELRADLASRITNMRRLQANMQLREKTVAALVSLVEEDAPEPLVQAETRDRLDDLAARLTQQGLTADQWLQMSGRTQEQLLEELRDLAERAVKADLALRAVADAESLDPTEEDLEDEFTRLGEQVNEKPARVRKEFERVGSMGALVSDLRKRQALDWLVERVEIVDDDGQPIDRAQLEPPDDSEDSADTVGGTPAAGAEGTSDSSDSTEASAEGAEATDQSGAAAPSDAGDEAQ